MRWENNVPNYFTLLRLVCIPVLWFLAFSKLKIVFGIVLSLAALTDGLDGYFARKLKQESDFGSWFDSLADTLLDLSLIFLFWILFPDFVSEMFSIIILVITLFFLKMSIGYVKYHLFTNYHMYSGKASFVLISVFAVHAVFFEPNDVLFYLAAIVLTITFIEGSLVSLTNKTFNQNRKSIFTK